MASIRGMKRLGWIGACAATALLSMSGVEAQAARAVADYELTAHVPLGAPGAQDYLTFDAGSGLLYIAQGTRVTVFDTHAKAVVGSIGPFHDTHGVAVVPALGKGFADSGDDGVVKVFNLKDRKITGSIKVSEDADGMVFDAHTGLVLVVAGDAHNLTTIDPANEKVAKAIDLGGKPEFLALAPGGKIYINLADVGKIAKVDIASGKVETTWSLASCKTPRGLAYDAKTNRLFSGCANGRLIVVDARDGRILGDLPIGAGSDGVAVDTARGLAFSSNGEGTLSVIKATGPETYGIVRTIPTFFGGRNMTIDPASGALYVAHPNLKREPPPKDSKVPGFSIDGVELAVFEPRF
ncbi:MAG TPA: YncE family protein [Phenylobacterium sp.]|nr:YncE family protein [Phenylobacterium sp.]